jgi:hypothetical protein
MNWYKINKYSQVSTIGAPPDVTIPLDNNEDDDDECWRDHWKEIDGWVKSNINSGPLLEIQKSLIEEIAIFYFKNGMDIQTMLWHDYSDFFVDRQYRTCSISLTFNGFFGGNHDDHECFNLETKTNAWTSILRTSNIIQFLQGLGCKIKFIDEDLYLFVFGKILNSLCYNNKSIANTFQLYLDKNLNKLKPSIISYIIYGSEIGRYLKSIPIDLGEEIDITNGGFKCYPYDYRFDYNRMGISFKSETTVYLEISDEDREKIMLEHGDPR